MRTFACALMLSALCAGAAVPVDLSAVKQGLVAVDSGPTSLTVHWKDEAGHRLPGKKRKRTLPSKMPIRNPSNATSTRSPTVATRADFSTNTPT